jgi:hypothetical protein
MNLEAPSLFVVRLVELAGKSSDNVQIVLPGFVTVISAIEIDLLELLERNGSTVKFHGNIIDVPMGSYEIKTLKFKVMRQT